MHPVVYRTFGVESLEVDVVRTQQLTEGGNPLFAPAGRIVNKSVALESTVQFPLELDIDVRLSLD